MSSQHEARADNGAHTSSQNNTSQDKTAQDRPPTESRSRQDGRGSDRDYPANQSTDQSDDGRSSISEEGDEKLAPQQVLQLLAEYVEDLQDPPERVPDLLTIDDVLERVPWSRPTIMKMVRRREIPMVKKHGRWIITREEWEEARKRHFEAPKGARTYHG